MMVRLLLFIFSFVYKCIYIFNKQKHLAGSNFSFLLICFLSGGLFCRAVVCLFPSFLDKTNYIIFSFSPYVSATCIVDPNSLLILLGTAVGGIL